MGHPLAHRHVPILLVLLLTAASLGHAVTFPYVNWDDPTNVVNNPLTSDPFSRGPKVLLLTPHQGYPIPVTILSHAMDRALFGPGPAPAHVVNLLLHLFVVAIAYLLFLRLGANEGVATRAVLLLALHPLVVEPVCWVTGRKDLLAAALLLAALVVIAGPQKQEAANKHPAPRAARWLAAQLLGALALVSKPSAVVAPLLLALVGRHCHRSLRLSRLVAFLLPLGVFASLVTYVGVKGERALGVLPPRSTGTAVADVLGALALQTKHLLWPRDLLATYYRGPGDPPAWAMTVAATLVLSVGLVARWFRSCPAGDSRGAVTRLGLLLALLAYLPASNVLGIARWVADSYMYLSLAFIGLGLVGLGQQLWPPRVARIAPALWIALALTLSLLSFIQSSTWSSSARLWAPVAERYPNNPVPLARLGLGQLYDGDELAAARTLVHHRQRFPHYDLIICDQAWAYERLGQRHEADTLLARGVRQQKPECVQHYVRRVLTAASPPPFEQRETVRLAFEQALPPMEQHVRDPLVFARAAALLQRLGLRGLARRTARRARALAVGSDQQKRAP